MSAHLRSLFACLLLLSLLLCGCGFGVETVTLTLETEGGIQAVSLGALVRIRLEGNASTGYAWMRVTPESILGCPVEALQEGAYITATDLPGSPGVFAFDYHAMQRGTVTLEFEHKRTWEEDAIDTFAVTLWVR